MTPLTAKPLNARTLMTPPAPMVVSPGRAAPSSNPPSAIAPAERLREVVASLSFRSPPAPALRRLQYRPQFAGLAPEAMIRPAVEHLCGAQSSASPRAGPKQLLAPLQVAEKTGDSGSPYDPRMAWIVSRNGRSSAFPQPARAVKYDFRQLLRSFAVPNRRMLALYCAGSLRYLCLPPNSCSPT
jgi:hypothetical protein